MAARMLSLPFEIAAILRAAVIAILITATETLTEVVAILVRINVRVAVGRASVGGSVLVVEATAISPVRLPCADALLIAVIHGLLKNRYAVLIRLVVTAIAIDTIAAIAGSVVDRTIAIARVLKTYLLLTQALQTQLLRCRCKANCCC